MLTKEKIKKNDSFKNISKNVISQTDCNYDEVKRKINQGNIISSQPLVEEVRKGPSKSQINKLKKFYYSTRYLPNSAFTTYFGKPAFENYGNGNINPVYGGLIYGNYMLSHNMNPIDGVNHPHEKQVYSSAMMKSLQRSIIRRPSPPRKELEEIRNTPEELKEIRTRMPIFQLPNNFPSRYIIPPNLLKTNYFNNGKNTPENLRYENEDEYEDWNIQNVLSGKKNKIIKIPNYFDDKFNPYNQGRIQLKRRKMKEDLDNNFSEEFYRKPNNRYLKNKGMNNYYDEGEEEEREKSEGELLYEKQRDYYLKMLGEDYMRKIEDLTSLEVQKGRNIIKGQNLNNMNNLNYIQNNKNNINYNNYVQDNNLANKVRYNNYVNNINPQINYIPQQNKIAMLHKCNGYPVNILTEQNDSSINLLKKKENPALLPPNIRSLNNNQNNNFICCVHHSQLPINYQDKDPRNYQGMPPCMLSSIIPAGKPSHLLAPLNIFASEYDE